jgi:hypothetical protein
MAAPLAALTAQAQAAASAPLPVISNAYSDDYIWEHNSATQDVILRFARSGDLSAPSSVKVTLADGTASHPSDRHRRVASSPTARS